MISIAHIDKTSAPRVQDARSLHSRDHCSTCSLHSLCLPTGLCESEMNRLDKIIGRRRKVLKDEALYRMDDPFTTLYAVRLGHFKTHQVTPAGDEQITGFHMAGELLGMDAISTDRHHCYAVALEDSEVCEIPFAQLEQLFAEMPTLLRHFHRLMSQEITRDQNTMLLLGNMRAEQRFAAFLVNLSSRYKVRGYSPTSFQLRMSREDIGNYLGLTIESISRLLARFKKQALLKVSNREIELLDLPMLKQLAMQGNTAH
ncbi:CRP/FNR family transcriptional regulator, anaerobic regulatory protein [Noviherbaspirillum humi]|uniref:CRP/FNR family transcriptional regulator, anaerobic regulatory protein n=1 Tax=Noviherbaspirillum humi TaxID=1688639 RepID=A0A239I709_9BURK|nr:fumarate/nitrate reduction transcriptional regulator Fnr [Noviherbaspirillum humi]SNS89309.1 CRP/FNR family transcriptional regulator, anaerobic regulatory protein [Noviherbaspirillum humi]